MKAFSNRKIKDIISFFPHTEKIFKNYNINYEDNGEKSLIEIIEMHGLDEKEVLKSFNYLYINVDDTKTCEQLSNMALLDLANYIINVHHTYLYDNLPIVSDLIIKTLRLHGLYHPEIEQVYTLFHIIKMKSEIHFIKEETIQYDAIEKYEKTKSKKGLRMSMKLMNELDKEHEELSKMFKSMRDLTENYSVPDDASYTYKLTYEKLKELEDDLHKHMYIESNILFKRISTLIKE